MFADIILLIGIILASGIVGGLVVAEHFDLEPHEKRRRARRQARKNR